MTDGSEFRLPQNPTVGLTIDPGGAVTKKFLGDIMHNDSLNFEKKLDPMLRNVNPEPNDDGRNKPRKHGNKIYLQRDLVMWCDIHKFTFGPSETVGADDPRPSWKSFRYDFPSNADGDFFHDEYQPAVVTQLYNSPNLQSGKEDLPAMTLVMVRIATNFFKFDMHQLESGDFLANLDDFWIAIMAIGRKGDYFPKTDTMLKAPDQYIPLDLIPPGTQVV